MFYNNVFNILKILAESKITAVRQLKTKRRITMLKKNVISAKPVIDNVPCKSNS